MGSVAQGFKADLCLVDIDRPCYQPMTDLIHHIVYGGSSRDVVMKMVNGRVLYEQGQPMGVDLDALYARVQSHYDNLFNV